MKLLINIEIFQEGDVYVALAPELNISSFGETVEDSQNSLREAVQWKHLLKNVTEWVPLRMF